MGMRVIDHLKHAQVNLKSKEAQTGQFLQVADDNKLVAKKKQSDSITVFKEITAIGEDGQTPLISLAALQVDDKYFLVPKKPKDVSRDTELKLRPKKIKMRNLFDKKHSKIAGESRKYWFRVKTVGDAQVYESLAYPGFYVSVEGKEVLMRKCSEDLPDGPNYHIYVMPPVDKKPESNAEHYARTTTTSMWSGSDDNGAGAAMFVRTDEHTVANATSDLNLEHFEVDITNMSVAKSEELAGSPQRSAYENGGSTGKNVALEELSEIETFSVNNGPEAQEDTVICEHVEEKVIRRSSAADDVVETEIIEEEITTKKLTEAGDKQNGVVQLPSDVLAENGLTADDSGADVTLPREKETELDEGELNDRNDISCKRALSENGITKDDSKTPAMKSKRSVMKSSFWSKMFSCVSSRSAACD